MGWRAPPIRAHQRLLLVRVVSMPSEQPRWAATGYDERATWTAFLVTAFATLEDSMVRAQALRLVSLPMWSTLAPKHLQQQLAALPQLARPWKLLTKRRAKEAKMDTPPVSSIQERDLIPELLRAFLTALATAGGEIEEEDDDAMQVEDGSAGGAPTSGLVRYLECTLELIIDLLSQLPTRRFFHAVVLDQHVIESAELSAFALSGSPAAKRFNQLLAMAKFYETYEIDDHTGTALTDAEVKAARCEQLIALQRAAFAMDGLQDFALSNLSAIDSAASLHNHFSRLSSAQLASSPPPSASRIRATRARSSASTFSCGCSSRATSGACHGTRRSRSCRSTRTRSRYGTWLRPLRLLDRRR